MATKCNKDFPECRSCINRELDPFECEDCEDASNFEPEMDEVEEVDYDDFLREYRHEELA